VTADGPVELHIVSDATGETATRIVAAVQVQFPEQEFAVVRHPRVEAVADLELALERMTGRRSVVIYTLVEPELRAAMRELCRRRKVHYCDLLQRPLDAVAKVSGRVARMEAGARPPLDEGYFRRISAIEFAVRQDDGLGRNLKRADVVLCGVSRTSKTPLSIYLGFLGWRAANVALVHGIDPPAELYEVDRARVVGLTIAADRLAEIRSERVLQLGGDRRYASLEEVHEDLDHARVIHRRLGCPVLDVTEQSIEEIALRIIRTVEQRTRR
jgi:regulator of PEP synthase PpsR (kinase-PPPase family)